MKSAFQLKGPSFIKTGVEGLQGLHLREDGPGPLRSEESAGRDK